MQSASNSGLDGVVMVLKKTQRACLSGGPLI
jgi:hypothetical protein